MNKVPIRLQPRHTHTCKYVGWSLFVVLCTTAFAARADVFSIENVEVDISSRSATTARESAMASGQRIAFERLLRLITLETDHSRLPELSDPQIAAMVSGLQIGNERASSRRYLATMSVSFRPDAVRALLAGREIPVVETQARPALILPVYETAGAIALWESPNPWREAWDGLDLADRMRPLRLPAADLQDTLLISSAEASSAEPTAIREYASRYEAGEVLIMAAHMRFDPERGQPILDIAVTSSLAPKEPVLVVAFEGRNWLAGAELIRDAAASVADALEDDWRAQAVLSPEERGTLVVWSRLSDLDDWLTLRTGLVGASVVRSISLLELRSDSARIEIAYLGSLPQLQISLAQQDLRLDDSPGYWEVGPL